MLVGVCWHVGNMTPLVTFGYIFASNIYMKGLFVLYAFICNSRTTLIGIVCCIGLEIICYFRLKENRIKRVYVGIGIIGLVGTVIVLYDKVVVFAEKITMILNNADGSALTHLRYWTSVPRMVNHFDIVNVIFGFGLENSGYPFATIYSQYVGSAWVVECDYINQLWSTGVLGCLLAYGWYIYMFGVVKKRSYKCTIFILALLVEGITYNVMFKWMWILLFALYSVVNSNIERKGMVK